MYWQQNTTTHNNRKRNRLKVLLLTDSAYQMDFLWHNCYTLSMDGAQVSVFKEAWQIVLCSLLKCLDSAHLKVQVMCHLHLGNLTHQACKGLLADEKLSAPLVLSDLVESNHVPSHTPGTFWVHPLETSCGVFLPVVSLTWPTSPQMSMSLPPLPCKLALL